MGTGEGGGRWGREGGEHTPLSLDFLLLAALNTIRRGCMVGGGEGHKILNTRGTIHLFHWI